MCRAGDKDWSETEVITLASFDVRESVGYKMEDDHLVQGLSLQAMVHCLLAIGIFGCTPDREGLEWVSNESTSLLTGYDVCKAVKKFMRDKQYEAYSLVEALICAQYSSDILCAGKAHIFFSHAQLEDPWTTLRAIWNKCNGQTLLLYFFIDYFCLRQCVSDFHPHLVKLAIRKIGWTVLMIDPVSCPSVLQRVWCVFEIASTLGELETQLWKPIVIIENILSGVPKPSQPILRLKTKIPCLK